MAKFVCQVCDHEIDPELSFNDAEEIQLWTTHTIELGSSYVRIIACQECSMMSMGEIFVGYQVRIRDGRDFRYH